MDNYYQRLLFNTASILIFMSFFAIISCSSISCDSTNSQVIIRFQLVIPKDWTSTVRNQLKTSVSKFTNFFCKENITECGLKRLSSFNSGNVFIASGYPKEDIIHSLVSIYVKLPTGEQKNDKCIFLRKSVLAEIISMNKEQLQLDLKHASTKNVHSSYGFRVSHVNGASQIKSTRDGDDAIFIPLICAFVFVLALITILLECNSKRQHTRLLNRVIQEKQASKASQSRDGSFAIVAVDLNNKTASVSVTSN
ncbi:uncharacterized protein LOC120336134 [Styela clava]|uniref:uncharacterized protein LOC120336134 n=1 Tax=Styela clava TaxID=7725 RepID=UPI00193AD8DE|nr:uncharacterized protein LOC120336134 [Styela clava]